MKQLASVSLFFCAIFIGAYTHAPSSAYPGEPGAAYQDPCPVNRPVKKINYNKQIIQAPQSNEEVQRLLDKIHAAGRNDSLPAIIALAMAGNIEAFQELLSLKNPEKLRIYCSYYQNINERKCIDPVIEQAIMDHFDDPALLESLLQVFRKNLYQRKDLFEKLLAKKLTTPITREFELTINALVATNLPGIEKQVIAHALENVASIDRKFWWSMMPIDKHYLDFFINRGYEPCLEFIEKILNDTHYSTTPEPYRVHLYNRQRALYYQLDKFTTINTGDIFISQLSKLVNLPFDFYYNLELEAAGRYAISHAQTIEQRNRVVSCLADILNTNTRGNIPLKEKLPVRPGDDFHYKVYCRVIGLLAQAQTDHAAAVLIKELARLAGTTDDPHIASNISQVLTGLSAFPETVSIDVPQLLTAVSALKEYDRSLTVVMILEKHPHPKGLEHLLKDLEYVSSINNIPGFSYGMSNAHVFDWFINLLLSFDKPDYLYKTRQEIDRLYQGQMIDQKRYEAASRRFNALLGNESPIFTAMRKQKEAEEKKRKQALALQQKKIMWTDFESQIAYNMSSEGIQRNLELYEHAGSHESPAVNWLVLAGTKILPQAHKMLLDKKTSRKLKFKLITLLGIIGDSRSIPPILKVLRKNPEMIHKDVFLSLSHIPITNAAYKFVKKQIIKAKTPQIQQSGLIYFAFQKEPRASHWIDQFTADGVDEKLQSAALFLAARLGDKKAEKRIVTLLKSQPDRYMKPILLRALAELLTPDALSKVIEKTKVDPGSKSCRNMLILSGFRHAAGAAKADLAEKLLKSEYLWDRRDAVQYLIANNNIDILQKYIMVDERVEMPYMLEAVYSHIGQLMVLEASKMGFLIKDVDDGIVLKKR